jgi:D-alanyl-D-alanine carboxypeptidase (penicillin-binding protein 5/6)
VLAPRRAAVGATLLATALLSVPAAALAQPAGVRAPGNVTAEPVGGPDLASPGVVMHAKPGAQQLPKIDADAWVLADITTGEVLAAKAAHRKVMPASTLKTLTALTLMPVLPKDQVVTVTSEATHADGSHVGIVSGGTYTVWDLWHGLLLPSGNDAAAALADAHGGMVPTVRAMQAKAIELGALDTSVRNDSGLDNPKQVTSAYDMALIARAALAIPDFATVTRTVSYDFPGKPAAAGAKRSTYKIYTQNRLLLHDFPGTVGGKTGFTSLAHRTFWGAAARGGHTLVVTLFQVRQPTEQAAKALLTWGFANRTKVTPVGTLVAPRTDEPAETPAATPSTAAAAGSDGTSAIGAGSTAVSLGSTARLLLVPLVLVLVVAGIVWWALRRRGRDGDTAGPVLLTAPAPDSTPVVVLPVVTPDDTAPVPVVRSTNVRTTPGRATPPTSSSPTAPASPPATQTAPAQPAAPVQRPVEAAPPTEPAEPGAPAEESAPPAAPARPVPRPDTGGHVRIVRPPGSSGPTGS